MIRTFSSILVLAALTGPALAEDITVRVAGRAPEAVQADIERAAAVVCRKAYATVRVSPDEQWACERAAAADAQAKIRAAAVASAAPVTLASAGSTTPRN